MTPTYKILIAETAPIIIAGFVACLNRLKEVRPTVIEVDSKTSLLDTISTESIDLLLVNPTFGGLVHPDEIRKCSLNSEIKIFAIEIGRIPRATLSLYDDCLHVTADMIEIRKKLMECFQVESEDGEEKECLSLREKEIITHVVKGMTNQEIADKLYLSIHTVMTHRRNIAKKLQIHSATGLTIYAIVNKLVDLKEIKL